MRLVIPYRLPADGGIELRYAIRSIVKYFSGLTGVLLIGDKPEWYTGDHIPMADLKGQKERSMQLKIDAVPDEMFLYSNDDYFALQPFNQALPNYYDMTCGQIANLHSIPSYKDMYDNCPRNWLNFDVHTPMVMNKHRFSRTLYDMDGQTPIKTTYGNGHPALPGQYLADIKIRGQHTRQEIFDKIDGRPFFSTHDSAINDDMISVFETLYPDVSPYEK